MSLSGVMLFLYVKKKWVSIENNASSIAQPAQLSGSKSVDCCHSLLICQIFINYRQLMIILIDFLYPVENPVLSPFTVYCNIYST